MFTVFAKNASLAVELIAKECAESATGDVCEVEGVFARFTLDSIGSIGFGVNLNSLVVARGGEEEGTTGEGGYDHRDFGAAFDTATALTSKRLLQPFWKLYRFFNFLPGDARKMRDACATIKRFTRTVIRERRQAGDFESKADLLSRFMRLSENDGRGTLELKDGTVQFTDEELQHLVINFVLAGRDTTANVLTWAIYELAKNPEVVEKIRQEQKEKFNDSPPSFDTVSSSMYLKAVFYEALRLHPSVPTDFKTAVNDDVLPDGTLIKAGDRITFVIYAMGRSSELWDEPLAFRPERHFDEEGRVKIVGYRFPAFICGPRECIGKESAFLSTAVMLLAFLKAYDVMSCADEEPIYTTGLTLWTDKGFRVRLKNRSPE